MNNINLNSPLNSSTNNSSNLNYSPNFMSLNFNQQNNNNSSILNQQQNQNQQQQKHKAPQIYMSPNLPYITGLSQLNQNSKDLSSLKKDKNQNEDNLNDIHPFNNNNNRQMENLINNNQFMTGGDMYMGMGGISPNGFMQKNYHPQMAYGMNGMNNMNSMNNLLMQNYEQKSQQMFHANEKNNLYY